LAARNIERLDEAVVDCQKRGGKAIAIPTDVTSQVLCSDMVKRTVERFGRIDALVNNAGITMWGNFDAISDLGILEQILRVNYLGSMYCTHFALPYLKMTKGLLVGVSSLAGKSGVPTRSGYAASKHAMTGFFDSLRIELKPFGVSVTMIYPGFVASQVRARALGPDGKPLVSSPVREEQVMPVDECARIIVSAMTKRKREEVMTLRGKVGQWIKLIAPGLVDRVASQAIKAGR
jgi:short-subunit dehydrogenase